MSAAPTPIHGRAVTAIVDLLNRERLMTLAVNRPDGWPQATTVGYLNDGLNLYFIVARSSQKFANLTLDSRASIAIRSESGVGLSMGGRVVEVVDPEAVERLNQQVIQRYPDVHVYSPSGDAVAVLHFRPSIISATGVVGGRSDAETFTIGGDGPELLATSVSKLF